MNVSWSGVALSGAPVHAGMSVDRCHEILRDRFLRDKLALTGLVLASLPLGLAYGGRPSPIEAAFFALALMPLAAALLLARGGRLPAARCVVGLGEAAIALLLAAVAGAGAASAWLVLALVEVGVAAGGASSRWSLAAIVAAASAILALDGAAAGARAAEASTIAGLAALAVTALAVRRSRDGAPSAGAPTRDGTPRQAALLAAMRDAVATFDLLGNLIDDVSGCALLLDCPGAALRQRGFLDIVHIADRPLFLKLLADAAHGTATTTGIVRLLLPSRIAESDGIGRPRQLVVEMRARASGDEILALLRDVGEEQRRDAAIDDATRTSGTALRVKTHFLSNMSHELRTPLNAIIGFSEMLTSRTTAPRDPAVQREYAGIIHQSGQHLLGVVNAILDMSKIQSGTYALLPEPFPLLPLVEQCCEAVGPQARSGRVDLLRDVPTDLEELVADRRVCRQILINLLTNAVKFTPAKGRVTLRVRPEGTAMRITVIDTGIGIAEADLAQLGEPFFQAGSTLSRPYEGTGLGLPVVRGLVGLHGGTIAIESAVGAGTIVTLRLPLDCRTGRADPTAAIETTPRRSSDEAIRLFETRPGVSRQPSDTRMKQSA